MPKKIKPKETPPTRIRKPPNSNKRIPRIQGITKIMELWNKTRKEEYLSLAQQHTINHYITHNLTLLGEQISIQELSRHSHTPEHKILERLGNTGQELWILSEDGTSSGVRAIKNYAIRGAFEAITKAEKQANVLLNAQNGHYVPFLSTATNAAIANFINANKPLLDMLKNLMPTQPTTAIQINNHKAVPAEKAIGANEAVMLINQQKEGITLLENPEAKAKLLEEHIRPETLPEVVATKQQGTLTNDLSANIYRPSKVRKHENRNELNGDIIPLPE